MKVEVTEMENDLKTIAFIFVSDIYAYMKRLEEKGHGEIARRLMDEAMGIDFAASFAASALGKDKFLRHLEEGYYAAGRTEGYLKLIAASGIRTDGHDELAESVDKMHRMFAASVKTMQKKNAEAYA